MRISKEGDPYLRALSCRLPITCLVRGESTRPALANLVIRQQRLVGVLDAGGFGPADRLLISSQRGIFLMKRDES
jgi:hypothetical protein